ncbi:uncharacterized protein LOC123228237 [Mangifera indica]|uniref:uncharacterized protein LOC123228237 n=1 Tax=Mangifera indica TaxID=29780 RepID=UPI001CFA5905|nr:uncharacterized protein LOC123228237 [Mangifera indica]
MYHIPPASSSDLQASSHLPKMLTATHEKSLQIKQDDKFFTRIMSKEASVANSSSMIYYGGASRSVPFMWESQPGTPKHQFSDTALPPLTPPPSYHSNSKMILQKKVNKPKPLNAICPSRFTKNSHVSPNSLSSWSCASFSSSSSWSSSRSINSNFQRRCISCSSRTRMHYNMDDQEDHQGQGSPTSTLCFGGAKAKSSNGGRARYSLANMKNAFFSIVVSHGSNHQGSA